MKNKNQKDRQLQYRPDIDGLRAIAVLSVVGFHAFPSLVRGGFIGVDIFFVISGYLITTIIFSHLENDDFSVVDFYNKRIRRIFPALLTVFTSSFIFGWFFLLSDEYAQLGKHIFGGSSFLSNFLLYKESGYFDDLAETKPMLHLWSLAIEEQFYIIWPIFLILVWKYRLSFFRITLFLWIISFVSNIYLVQHNPVAAFYWPFPRFWELMVGCLLVFILQHNIKFINKFKNAQSLVGFSLISIGIICINKDLKFPGWWVLLPTFGAFFIILAGQNSYLNNMLLANRFMRFIGVISYPLYLWHWVLLSFDNIIEGQSDHFTRVILIILSVFLSWLTYCYIEKPVRFNKNVLTSKLLILTMFFCGLIGFILNKQKSSFEHLINGKNLTITSPYYECELSKIKNHYCILGNINSEKIIVVYGDSHINHLTRALNSAIGGEYKIYLFTCSSCFFGENIKFDSVADNPEELLQTKNILKEVISSKQVYAVIRAQRWHGYGLRSQDMIEAAISDSLNFYGIKYEKLIIVGSTSNVDRRCYLAKYFKKLTKSSCDEDMDSHADNIEFMATTRRMHSPENVFYIYPFEKLCPNNVCNVINGNVAYYYDRHHLTESGAQLIMPDIVNILKK